MAFTCGPHHFEHGLHILTTSRTGGPLDLAAVLVGFPAGVAWFLLRVEAVQGGRGDRTIRATPAWVESLPTLSAVYVVALVTAVLGTAAAAGASFDVRLTPNLALVALYAAIGVVLARTQLQNHQVTGNWSLSGLSLAVVFPTCALMHGVWAVYGATGRYAFDAHRGDVLPVGRVVAVHGAHAGLEPRRQRRPPRAPPRLTPAPLQPQWEPFTALSAGYRSRSGAPTSVGAVHRAERGELLPLW
jgi:hypothetical protein